VDTVAIREGRFQHVTDRARQYLEIVREARSASPG
jgi:hypothetical protein